MRWAYLLSLVAAAGCGDGFRANPGGGGETVGTGSAGGSAGSGAAGSGSGGAAGGGSAEPTPCETWCEQLTAFSCDVDWADCVVGCEGRFDDTCDGRALLSCYTANWNGCEIPSTCAPAAIDFALCLGLECVGATCDEHGGGVCACDEICTGSVLVSADCTSTAMETACTCTLTGPLAATSADATSTTCQGAKASAAWCTDDWGCCREALQPQ